MKPYSEEYWAYMKRQTKDELIKVFRGIAERDGKNQKAAVYILEVLAEVNFKYEALLSVMGTDPNSEPDYAANMLARTVLQRCGVEQIGVTSIEPVNTIDERIAYIQMGAGLRAEELKVDADVAMDFAEQGARCLYEQMKK
jgi:hypothetical protein